MESPTTPARVLRFGIFELDAHSRELRRHGLKVRLPDQAFQVLRLLLDSPAKWSRARSSGNSCGRRRRSWTSISD